MEYAALVQQLQEQATRKAELLAETDDCRRRISERIDTVVHAPVNYVGAATVVLS